MHFNSTPGPIYTRLYYDGGHGCTCFNSTLSLITLVDSLTGLLVNLEAKPEPRFWRGNSSLGLIYTQLQVWHKCGFYMFQFHSWSDLYTIANG